VLNNTYYSDPDNINDMRLALKSLVGCRGNGLSEDLYQKEFIDNHLKIYKSMIDV
jgi:hypothetical protein